MRKALWAVLLCVCILAVYSVAFAEVSLTPLNGLVQVKGPDGIVTLDASNSPLTVSDGEGNTLVITFDSKTGGFTAEAKEGTPQVLVGSAKIFLTEGQKVGIKLKSQLGSFSITNLSPEDSGDVDIVFPDGAQVSMPPASTIGLTLLADRNYMLNVDNGTVGYMDADGVYRTLGVGSAGVIVPGFTTLPLSTWRGNEPDDLSAGTP